MRFPFLAFLSLLAVSILLDYIIYSDIKHRCRRKLWPRIYGGSSIACWIFLIVLFLLPKRNVEDSVIPQMWMLFSYLSLYIGKLVYAIFALLGLIPLLFKRPRFPIGPWLGLPLGLLAIGTMWYGVAVTRHKIQTIAITVYSQNLPELFEGYRAVQISDLHTGTWGNDTTFVSALVDSINALHPDVIFFTGDIVNRRTEELAPFRNILSRLKAPDGVFSVLGNHDYGDYLDWDSLEEKKANNLLLARWEAEMGWQLLNNTHRFITRRITEGEMERADSIVLIGCENWGNPPFIRYGTLEKAYPMSKDSVYNLNDNRFKVLLTHDPAHWLGRVTDHSNIDLTLSGHTHAMQFEIRTGSFVWTPAQWMYPVWGGLYGQENHEGKPIQLYINIGSGEVGMPFRIGAVPEITLITLRKGEPRINRRPDL